MNQFKKSQHQFAKLSRQRRKGQGALLALGLLFTGFAMSPLMIDAAAYYSCQTQVQGSVAAIGLASAAKIPLGEKIATAEAYKFAEKATDNIVVGKPLEPNQLEVTWNDNNTITVVGTKPMPTITGSLLCALGNRKNPECSNLTVIAAATAKWLPKYQNNNFTTGGGQIGHYIPGKTILVNHYAEEKEEETKNGGVWGRVYWDPIFDGFNGSHYEVTWKHDEVANLLGDSNVLMNARLLGLSFMPQGTILSQVVTQVGTKKGRDGISTITYTPGVGGEIHNPKLGWNHVKMEVNKKYSFDTGLKANRRRIKGFATISSGHLLTLNTGEYQFSINSGNVNGTYFANVTSRITNIGNMSDGIEPDGAVGLTGQPGRPRKNGCGKRGECVLDYPEAEYNTVNNDMLEQPVNSSIRRFGMSPNPDRAKLGVNAQTFATSAG